MIRGPTTRALLLAGLGIGSVGLAGWMLSAGLSRSIDAAAIVALFVGIAGLALAVADYFGRKDTARPDPGALADDLARSVQEQWLDEVKARQLRDPQVLPLTWSETQREVGDDAEAVHGTVPAGRVTRVRLDGRLEGRFDEVVCRLADGYGQLPYGRLVVLGEPGAGKTVLASLLALGLLELRGAGQPVPVLLTVASWDPVRESLDDWLVRTVAMTYYSGRQEIPRRLLDRELLLPILDGLDEIPETARRGAVRAINHAIGQERPVVVTCRSAEYEDVVAGGAPVLRRAPVVEIAPVPADDVIAYLGALDWPDGTVWDDVFAQLRNWPDSPVAQALSTPLMVSLARTVYQRCGGDPGELLGPERFDCRHAVEDYLADRVIDAAYAPERLPSGEPVVGDALRWDATDARRWLAFLAGYLHRHRERDLAWWQLAQRLLSPWAAPGIAVGVGGVLVVVFSVAAEATGSSGLWESLAVGGAYGAVFAIPFLVIWYAFAGRAPGRLSFAVRGSLGRLRRGFVTGLVLVAIPALPLATAAGLILAFGDRPLNEFLTYVEALAIGAALAPVVGGALAVHTWLDAPPERSARASPRSFVRQDRRSSLTGALAAGAVVGVLLIPALLVGSVGGRIVGGALTGWPGYPGRFDVALLVSHEASALGLDQEFFWQGFWAVGTGALAVGAVFGALVLLTRAWPRFAITRVLLAARGHLPWRLLGFLADARQRGLLRQAGGSYQFRHVRLQERLVDQPLAVTPTPSPRIHRTVPVPARPAVRRPRFVAVTAAAAIVLVTVLGPVMARPEDTSRATLPAAPCPGWGGFGGQVTLAVSPDGRTLATVHEGACVELRLWDVPTGTPIDEAVTAGDLSVDAMAFRADGQVLAVAVSFDNQSAVDLFDGATGEPFEGLPLTDRAHHLSFDVDGEVRALAAQTDDPPVQVWDTITGEPVGAPLDGDFTDAEELRVRFSPGSSTVATIAEGRPNDFRDYEVQVWDIATGEPVGPQLDPEERTDEPLATLGRDVVFSPDGRTLGIVASSFGRGDDIWLWDATTGEPMGESFGGPGVDEVAFAHDGRTVAAAYNDTSTVRLWDAATGRQIGNPFVGHTDDVVTMEFSPDGRVLATGSRDLTVRLWDVPTAGS